MTNMVPPLYSPLRTDNISVKIDAEIGNLAQYQLTKPLTSNLPSYKGTPGEILKLFVAGQPMAVETNYKAAYGFVNAS